MEKVKHNQRFYIVNQETYWHYYTDHIKKETGEDYKMIHYQWVIPMYVYSINKIWDGSETFDICPVDFSDGKRKSWKWRRSEE